MADYYEILGVPKEAEIQDIKRSYRKLALKYHPDRNRNDKASEEKFKKINEAYAVLSDQNKRRKYDAFGDNKFHQAYSSEEILRDTDFHSIFQEFNMSGSFSDIFSTLFRRDHSQQSLIKGQDIEVKTSISFEEAYHGSEKRIQFRIGGHLRSISIKIPAGIRSLGRLRIAGKGGIFSAAHAQPGDLFVVVEVKDHPSFRRDGQDIEMDLHLKISEFFLGAKKQIATPSGLKTLKVPPGIRPGIRLRLKSLGFPSPSGVQVRGDFYVKVQVDFKKNLSSEQKNLIQEMQKLDM